MRLNRSVALAIGALLALSLSPVPGSPAARSKPGPLSRPGISQLLALPSGPRS
ncbi:MAG: hypothetical protein WEB06_01020 [Actinomycetota bacterium]